MDLSLGGSSDSKALSGTARGWASGRPSDVATLLATRKSASAMIILDELDKADHGHGTGIGLQSYLLGLLEPETAKRLMDAFLKTECDFSGVMWIATANTLSGIHGPLLSRLRVLLLRQPSTEHFHVIAENVLVDIAKGWSLERDVLPMLAELELPWDSLSSARQVRVATEAAVMQWTRALRRH
jgi:ATP-dependent Lon protease